MADKETKTSPAKLAANARWAAKNKEAIYFNRDKSAAKRFINKKADKESLRELQILIENRLKEIENNHN
ncbi:hypothetical protein [Listeria booriae]|uniref:hypothetical protein n=1 Tax=Listeria booriae TaxID=1552123 RepID=UPI001627A3CE|nr:hypothetical protein [Listeria booriae]MBC1801072.1 hypothetical protein [Listeria booriae]